MDLNELDEGPLSDFQGATLQIHSDSLAVSPSSDGESVPRQPLSNSARPNQTARNISSDSSNANRTTEEIVLTPAVLSGADTVSPISSIQSKLSGAFRRPPPRSVTDVVSQNPLLAADEAKDYFTFRDGLVEKAIQECVKDLISVEQDGELIGSWLLTEISFWDNEKERLVILTSRVVTTVKYDFIALKQLEYRKVPIALVDTVVLGDLVYPSGSFVPSRNMRGLRAMWNRGEPLTFGKKWNPFNNEIPWATYTSHPLLYHKESVTADGNKMYDLEDFAAQFVSAVERAQARASATQHDISCSVKHNPIVLQSYVGLSALIHNRNSLGFFKVRGKFSF